MRVFLVCTLLAFSTVGLAFGQDTNFPNGPQYLMTSGSPLFAQSNCNALACTDGAASRNRRR